MEKKQLAGTMGLVTLLFVLFLAWVDTLAAGTWNVITPGSEMSLNYLWNANQLVFAVLISGFVLFAALLATNLQFTPPKEEH